MRTSLYVLLTLIACTLIWLIHPICAESKSVVDPETTNTAGESSDEAELTKLLEILDKHTEIATKSKLNADYVPGMVTVLDGKDLMSRGIRDVKEALSLVPGIDVILGDSSAVSINVRGLPEWNGYASTKFMLNGVPVNNAFSGVYNAFLNILSEQVERVEVIRGPGSAIHGGYANTGVINVITRTKGDAVYGETGSYATYGAGGLVSWSDPAKDLHVSLNLAGSETDGADTRTGPDRVYSFGQGDISNAPGPANEDSMMRSAITELAYKDFSFIAQYLRSGHGEYFGVNNALPDDSDGTPFKNEYWLIELSQDLNISPVLKINIKLGYMSFDQNTERILMFPAGFRTPLYTYSNGMYGAIHYEEDRYSGELSLTYSGWAHHKIFTELSVSQTYQGDNTQWRANFNPYTLEPSPTNTMDRFDDAFIGDDRERRINSLVVQDEFSAGDRFDITAGLRFDSYDDTDDNLSPRLAAVWRFSDTHIFKAQYAQAYMPPSFLQLYHQVGLGQGNSELKPQTSENYELGYIYRGQGNAGRLTLFHSDLKQVPVIKDNVWSNSGGALVTGAELELEQSLFSKLKLDGNIAYAYTEEKETGEAIPEAANWWANAGISYNPLKKLLLNAQYRYVGEHNRAPEDTRQNLKAFHTIDVTGNLFNLFFKGLTFRTGVKNIFDEDVRYAASPNTYPDDYPQAERSWWCEVSYEF